MYFKSIKTISFAILTLICFSAFKSVDHISIKLTDFNKELDVSSFHIDESSIILDDNGHENLYVQVNSRKIVGKERTHYKRTKRKGQLVTLKFILKNKESNKKIVSRKATFMHWSDGEVYTSGLLVPLNLGKYHFKVELDK